MSVSRAKRNWMIGAGLGAAAVLAGLTIAASVVAGRIEPYARQAAIGYLSRRFHSDVQMRELHLRLPQASVLPLLFGRGRGLSARVEAEDVSMRLKGGADARPLFAIRKFSCEVELHSLFHPPVVVSQVLVDGMTIRIPPRHPRTPSPAGVEPESRQASSYSDVIIAKATVRNAALWLLPGDPRRSPLRIDIQALRLQSAAAGAPMRYDAVLTNPKPPGQVHVTGAFGPWRAAEPGDTPIDGDYLFENADLGVFRGIAGTLHSTGRFQGRISALKVEGQASIPDFRLRRSGNPVPLFARLTATVDATDGNTVLAPVAATLGSTSFTTSGAIIRHQTSQPRGISLDVSMPDGDLRDVLRLAMKGSPFMEGRLAMHSRIDLPPPGGSVRDRLELDGQFEIRQGKFLHSDIQRQIDRLSKRAQGQPETGEADSAVSRMTGAFHMADGTMRFSRLSFGVPGAAIDLAGDYDVDRDSLDFGGTLKLQATVSQLIVGSRHAGGWKGAALSLLDRFFERGGAGTDLPIRVRGTPKTPNFSVVLAGRQIHVPMPKR